MKIRGLAVVRGGGDIASGTIMRLHMSGFGVIVLETEMPTSIRRTVSFSQAIFDERVFVEGVVGRSCNNILDALKAIKYDEIPVIADPNCDILKELKPLILVDAILAKKNFGTRRDMANIVIGLGPGFTAGMDVDAVIETKRGHDLGKVIYDGSASENTGIPGNINGYTTERVIYSPSEGKINVIHDIGTLVDEGETIAVVGGKEVVSKIPGMIRGMIQNNSIVFNGMKIGDVDPRGKDAKCFSISDKARAVAGGVLEAVLHLEFTKNKDVEIGN